MKKTLFMLVLLLPFAYSSAKNKKQVLNINGNDSTIRYVGRTLSEQGAVSFDWSGTYLEFSFVGEEISLHAGDSQHSYYNCIIDQTKQVIEIQSNDTVILLANKLNPKKIHTLRLQKRSEGNQGLTSIKGFEIKGKKATTASIAPKVKRHIEFIGDSYTCGYGVEAASDARFSGATENCDLAHGAILARLFDADYNFVANSGRGVVRNYGNPSTTGNAGTMRELIKQTFNTRNEPSWDYSNAPYTPDIVVIFLGINDYSTQPQPSIDEFSAGYKEMIQTLRAGYGKDVPILCIAPTAGNGVPKKAIDKMIMELGDKKVHAIEHFDNMMSNPADLGADYHPNITGQRKVAMLAAPYISTITGWPIPNRPIE